MVENELILFWQASKRKIIAYISKKVQNTDDAADILQEVFIKFWENNKEIKDKGKILHWLTAVTRFTIADYFREKQKRNNKSNPEQFEPDNQNEPDHVNSDESKKLLPVIQSLPVKYRNILLLSDIYGLQHKVISEQLNLSVTCIKQRVVRARKLLAEKMKCCCNFTHDKYGNIVNCTEKPEYKKLLEKIKNNDIKLSPF